jgi:signal transduction histidine kinase
VEVSVRGEPDAVVLEVHNRGEPIPPDTFPRIFEAFQRGTPNETGRSPGLGLGLYIVQQIVAAHGGSVEVRSSRDEGTTLTVRWPRSGARRDA